jgi:hypothetical protein
MRENEDSAGVNELAAYIVSSMKADVIEGPIGERFEVKALIDEAVLLEIAREEIAKALPSICEAVAKRLREDLTRGLNA